jgi:pimeloyl-[acyl-carrier protein] methyl ester esterase
MYIDTQGHGPDLVLIHGWAMHGGILAPLTRILRSRFRLHIVDLPGHGRSRDSGASIEPAECARALAAQVPRAIWIGWSLGGLVALHAALDLDNVRGLVEIASSPRFIAGPDWPYATPLAAFEQFEAGLRDDYRGVIERFLALEALGSNDAQAVSRELRAQVFEHGEPDLTALEQGMRVLEKADLRSRLAELAMPSLWIAGKRDRIVPAPALRWAARECGGTLFEIDSGHAPFISHPAEVAQAIATFVQGVP